MVKIWLAKAIKSKFKYATFSFDEEQDEFALMYRNAALDVEKSLEQEGITEDCKLTLLHERYTAGLLTPKDQL